MNDQQSEHEWERLCRHLLLLPHGRADDDAWLADLLEILREAAEAETVVFWTREETEPDAWMRLAAAGAAVPQRVSLRGKPQGWCARLLSGALVAGVRYGRTGEPALIESGSTGDASPEWDGVVASDAALWGAPMATGDGVCGAIAWLSPNAPVWSADRMRGYASLVAQALANRRRVRLLDRKVITDELTGAYNYRFLRTALRREIRRASRFGQPLSVLMLDVDHLKDYNEVHGHLRGSQVLKTIAGVVRTGVRDIDLMAKYGGDEFLLILPQTEKVGAAVLADRLRALVAEHAFEPLAAGEMTCSVGVATYPDDAQEPEGLIAAADQALFRAKRTGRNRVVAA